MKVFVSSTFIDLEEYRKAVDEIINRLSLQYRGMEYFGSRPYEPTEACFNEIKQCQIFVGIYAHRYGHIPGGVELSITEQEFDLARDLGLDCFCYVIDPNYPWPPPLIEHNAADKHRRLIEKVSTLTRSVFTTPDNLAKQVAADLQIAFQNRPASLDTEQLRDRLHTLCKQEIASTIGPKYIRDLYVGRKLNSAIKSELKRGQSLDSDLKLVSTYARLAADVVASVAASTLPADVTPEVRKVQESLPHDLDTLESLKTIRFPDTELCYPAVKLNECLTNIKNALGKAQKSLPRTLLNNLSDDQISRWNQNCSNCADEINRVERSLRPVSLIVDRAGGGKTNLLCHLAEEISAKQFCFFVSAKSIPAATEEGLIQYLTSVYPIGDDPLGAVIDAAVKSRKPIILIVDGINENLDPIQFNAAFKALVRRYYGKPVFYVVSCRDIYWNYFDDAWWRSHCSLISRDELYEFTTREFSKALPLYLAAYHISARPTGNAREQLHHPLLLRFYCEAFKGTPEKPTNIGQIDDIRLLELFDAYCNRKFLQIRERLQLISEYEVFDYLQVIARLMLMENTRLLPVRRIAHDVPDQFHEKALHSIDSRYVQILDEDILLEQKPVGPGLDLMVSFVYEEFMEYVISRALWSDICRRIGSPTYEEIRDVAGAHLKREKEFISVLGIVIFLGELLATVNQGDGLRYVDWLISMHREALACKLIVRWPLKHLDVSVFDKLIDMHRSGRSAKIKLEAWRAMGRLCLHNWDQFFSYLKGMSLTGYFRPMFVFPVLGRALGGPGPMERFETVKWITGEMLERASRSPYFMNYPDHKNGVGAIKRIISASTGIWNNDIRERAEILLNKAVSLEENETR